MSLAIAFFFLGALAQVLRAGVQFPNGLYQSLTLFLMIAIGLKGGMALSEHVDFHLIPTSLAVMTLGVVLAFTAFGLLQVFGNVGRQNAASLAAHYGSVSVGTYAAAVAFLEAQNISYEAYFPVFVVILEIPAIIVGTALLGNKQLNKRALLHHMFCNQGVLIMSGALMIGFLAPKESATVMPFFKDLFHGVMALFLLKMGMIAAQRLSEMQSNMSFITAFAVLMPLIGGLLGGTLGHMVGLSVGGTFLLAVLGASASYIAAPAAMQIAAPDANHGLSITASLALTFPFNLIIGLPLYIVYARWLSAI